MPSLRAAKPPLLLAAEAEVVEWDEFLQGYNAQGECVVCICGEPYPHRIEHYCPYDNATEDED